MAKSNSQRGNSGITFNKSGGNLNALEASRYRVDGAEVMLEQTHGNKNTQSEREIVIRLPAETLNVESSVNTNKLLRAVASAIGESGALKLRTYKASGPSLQMEDGHLRIDRDLNAVRIPVSLAEGLPASDYRDALDAVARNVGVSLGTGYSYEAGPVRVTVEEEEHEGKNAIRVAIDAQKLERIVGAEQVELFLAAVKKSAERKGYGVVGDVRSQEELPGSAVITIQLDPHQTDQNRSQETAMRSLPGLIDEAIKERAITPKHLNAIQAKYEQQAATDRRLER